MGSTSSTETSQYNVFTIAGNNDGFTDGQGTSAQFNSPNGITVDQFGNIFVADVKNNAIRKINQTGYVSTLIDPTGATFSFNSPTGLSIDRNGNLYITDTGNNVIKELYFSTGSNVPKVSTIAGNNQASYVDGQGIRASFNAPSGLFFDSSKSNIYVADTINGYLRQIDPNGYVTTIPPVIAGTNPSSPFRNPIAVCMDTIGNVFVSDSSNRILKYNSSGVISVFAGSGSADFLDGIGTAAKFSSPRGLIADAIGNLFVADYSNNRIRAITPTGNVTTIAGDGTDGSNNGPSLGGATFNNPAGIAILPNGSIVVSEYSGSVIRLLNPIATASMSITLSTQSSIATSILSSNVIHSTSALSTLMKISSSQNPSSRLLTYTLPVNLTTSTNDLSQSSSSGAYSWSGSGGSDSNSSSGSYSTKSTGFYSASSSGAYSWSGSGVSDSNSSSGSYSTKSTGFYSASSSETYSKSSSAAYSPSSSGAYSTSTSLNAPFLTLNSYNSISSSTPSISSINHVSATVSRPYSPITEFATTSSQLKPATTFNSNSLSNSSLLFVTKAEFISGAFFGLIAFFAIAIRYYRSRIDSYDEVHDE